MMPFISSADNAGTARTLSHYPRPAANRDKPEPRDTASCEKILAEWFGRPVILLSSGKAGINTVLQALGMHRYRNRLSVPPFISTCVLNSITPFAFPVDIDQNSDGILWYHQYGFPQRTAPLYPNVIEDCAHSFFSTANTGDRHWASDVAIFSLAKFFNLEGMAGGIIVSNPQLEEKLRGLVTKAPDDMPETRLWMRKIISNAFDVEGAPLEKLFIDSAYALLLQFIKPDPYDLAGFPSSTDEIRAIGRKRRERMEFIVDFFGKKAFPETLLSNYEQLMPFAMPCFSISDPKQREKADDLLKEIGLHAGIYHVDVERDCRNPKYHPCLLLPCHQDVPLNKLEEACKIIISCGNNR